MLAVGASIQVTKMVIPEVTPRIHFLIEIIQNQMSTLEIFLWWNRNYRNL